MLLGQKSAVIAVGVFFSLFINHISFLFPSSLRETSGYRVKYCLKEALNPNSQQTNLTSLRDRLYIHIAIHPKGYIIGVGIFCF